MRARLLVGLSLAAAAVPGLAFAAPGVDPTVDPSASVSATASATVAASDSASPSESPSVQPSSSAVDDWPAGAWPYCTSDLARYCIESASVTPGNGDPAHEVNGSVTTLPGVVKSFNWAVSGYDGDGLIRLTVRTGDFEPRYTMSLAEGLELTRSAGKLVIEGHNTHIDWISGDQAAACVAARDCGDDTTRADALGSGMRFMGNTQDMATWDAPERAALDGFSFASDAQARPTTIMFGTYPEPYWSLPYLGNPHLDIDGNPVRGGFNAFMPAAYFTATGTTAHEAATVGFDVQSTDAKTGEKVSVPVTVEERDGGVMLTVTDLGYSIHEITVYNRASTAPTPTPTTPAPTPTPTTPAPTPTTPTPTSSKPMTPTGVTAKGGPGTIAVSWASGGTDAESYVATAQPGARQCTVQAPRTGCEIGGLTDGTPYAVTVTATGAAGTSAPSAAVTATPASPQIPATVPAGDGTLSRGPATGQSRTITVSGDGFAPNSPVTIAIYSAPVALATGTADGNGHAELQVVIPNSYAGDHTLALAGIAPGGAARVLTLAVKVASTSTLPVTGAPVVPLAAYGAAFVLLGVLARAATRERPVRVQAAHRCRRPVSR
ncbi:fibronectin type III domain-containing protein [Dactylosporangium sp. CS-033363]|uniref:fibronectin type III domain-containing protein n=1 Tax=Dactylosporangium sp. CS-033363 TaxID=3239935 RepID=UPI003D940614